MTIEQNDKGIYVFHFILKQFFSTGPVSYTHELYLVIILIYIVQTCVKFLHYEAKSSHNDHTVSMSKT